MSKFVLVEKAPEKLRKGEMVIERPTFSEELKKSAVARPNNYPNSTTNYLRFVVQQILKTAALPDQISYTLPYNSYDGVPCPKDEDVAALLMKIIKQHKPEILKEYLRKIIKARPVNTLVIYYTGMFGDTDVFYEEGINKIEEREIDIELGLKQRQVGITKKKEESTEENKN